MNAFIQPLLASRNYTDTAASMKKGDFPIQLTGCIDSQKCHLISCLTQDLYPQCLVVTDNEQKARELTEDLRLYGRKVLLYPPKDIIFYSADIKGNAIVRERMKVLRALLERAQVTVVTTVTGGMDRLLPLSVLMRHILQLHETDRISMEVVIKQLTDLGYERQGQVETQGEFAVRGGILDIYCLTEDAPVRLEFWGDEIDSIRTFDVSNQRSIERIPQVTIYPASEVILTDETMYGGVEKLEREAKSVYDKLLKQNRNEAAARVKSTIAEFRENLEYMKGAMSLENYLPYFYQDTVSLFDYFSDKDSVIFLEEPARTIQTGEAVMTEFSESMEQRLEKGYILPSQAAAVFDMRMLLAKLCDCNTVLISTMDLKPAGFSVKVQYDFTVRSVSSYNSNFEALVKDLHTYKKNRYRILLLSGSHTRAKRLAEDLREYEFNAFYTEDMNRVPEANEIMITYGNCRRGFEYPLIRFVVISESDIFGVTDKKKRKKVKAYEGKKINSFQDLAAGDYVVHENHGVGIYRGIEKIEVDKIIKDFIKIEYGGGGVLYIPATGLDVIQKYAGAEARKPKLNKLNSVEWKTTKARVKGAVADLAGELIALYAKRQQKHGFAFSKDTVWQREFEELFPYEETDDQLKAIEMTKKDMESTAIMDRLICGDVGYGKTEIAIRAAFKAVSDGKQVVILVPTTILAQQHYNTFTQRMMDFPVSVDMLSRFKTPAQQKQIIERVRKGQLDVLIGTHRVLSKDITFHNLGLLVVDEEQRFGVSHKEKIKRLKGDVDVLTLTATPIPRTLHMSLVGIRDMSVLDEPPVDRQPIQTFVLEHNDEIIREAISRELARGGQVYYVFNRVHGIEDITANVQKLVPDAAVQYAHGQMQEHQLEKIMYEFINGEIDVLVSTTIIETGLDISNVNTIIIDDADRMGLAQLYQLRGRVGRSNRTASAFLMYRKDKLLQEVAEKRLQAIREFTELGSGFKIAMRDLEIRGAGNLLGAQQSGHMEAVGYDLYCKMLNEAVKHMKGEESEEDSFETAMDMEMDAYIPSTYIKNEMQKLDMYKRIAGIENEEEFEDMQDEMTDRFGEIPTCVNNLLNIAWLKAEAHRVYITGVTQKGTTVKLTMHPAAKLKVEKIPELLMLHRNTLQMKPEATPYFTYRMKLTAKEQTGGKPDRKRLFDELQALCKDFAKLL